MRIVVHKYGGSSLSTLENIKRVAQKVVARKRAGFQVAVVVSAMGDTTDNLLQMARAASSNPAGRELDMLLTTGEQVSMSLLSLAINEAGEQAVSLTGGQAGLLTTEAHNRATITQIHPRRVLAELRQGRIVVVAGFQGLSARGEMTTLGRGGSDTSAVALAAALKAQRCEIYSDVDGVYSSDPRTVPAARRLDEIGYDEMQELARYGARVLNQEAVEFAQRGDLPIQALSTFTEGGGTLVCRRRPMPGRVVGVAGRDDLLQVRYSRPEQRQQIRELFGLDAIVYEQPWQMVASCENVANPAELRRQLSTEIEGCKIAGVGAVALVGKGLLHHRDSLEKARRGLSETGIKPLDVHSGPLSIAHLVEPGEVKATVACLHGTFFPSEVLV